MSSLSSITIDEEKKLNNDIQSSVDEEPKKRERSVNILVLSIYL